MAEREAGTTQPTPAELLKAALEKIVFFEWRLSELSGELSAAHSRCAATEQERARAEDERRAAEREARAARRHAADLEVEQARLSAIIASSTNSRGVDPQALEAERDRCAKLEEQLDDARRELQHSRAERERWLSEMIEQARSGDEAPAALAQFISELRAEIIALRDHQKRCERMLAQAGIEAPAFHAAPPRQAARREAEPVEQARALWSQGRLAPPAAPISAISAPISPAPVRTEPFAIPAQPQMGAAARALADQCLRNLASADPARREQAARHLSASPLPAAAPALAQALGSEADAKTRAQLARALAACGGEGAAEIVAQLQSGTEPPLVRMAALDALSAISARARDALENAVADPAPALRRRAAAIAAADGFADLLARLAADPDASVRAAAQTAQREPAAAARQDAAPARRIDPEVNTLREVAVAAPRDPVRAALHRLVVRGGAS